MNKKDKQNLSMSFTKNLEIIIRVSRQTIDPAIIENSFNYQELTMKLTQDQKLAEAWEAKRDALMKKMQNHSRDEFWKFKTEGDALMGMSWILKKLKQTPEIVNAVDWVETTQRPDYFQRLNKWQEEYSQAQIEWEEITKVEKIITTKEREVAMKKYLDGLASNIHAG